MARTPMVTRTIQFTKAIILCLDIESRTTENKLVTLSRTYKDDAHIMKEAKKVLENDKIKAVHVVDSEIQCAVYGMPEQKFIELAEILPDRGSVKKEGK